MESFIREAESVDVASRLRELREGQAISMRTLATRSGLSANALSMIERGKTSPSVSTLYKMADALGVSITAFFGTEAEKKQVVFLKSDERTRMSFTRGVFEALGGENFAGRVEPFMLTLESGASCGPHDIVHSGHEFVFFVCAVNWIILWKKNYFIWKRVTVCYSLPNCGIAGAIPAGM
ncbi:MAG: helix-turn-helix domain-containing protein [Chloroflexi bacterium]|nr:helix-turn-helix domain-containing protein [Chloroflexota bacterium]